MAVDRLFWRSDRANVEPVVKQKTDQIDPDSMSIGSGFIPMRRTGSLHLHVKEHTSIKKRINIVCSSFTFTSHMYKQNGPPSP